VEVFRWIHYVNGGTELTLASYSVVRRGDGRLDQQTTTFFNGIDTNFLAKSVTQYQYDATGNLTIATPVNTGPEAAKLPGSQDYRLDLAGNMTSGTTRTFGKDNRLKTSAGGIGYSHDLIKLAALSPPLEGE
jgi:hypothetical protein